MGKVIVEQIVSVDGYAEDADGSIDFFVNADWVNEVDTEQLRMLSGVSAIVLGERTNRMFADYWPTADPVAEPVALGRGRSFAPPDMGRRELTLASAHTFGKGLVVLEYQLVR